MHDYGVCCLPVDNAYACSEMLNSNTCISGKLKTVNRLSCHNLNAVHQTGH
uniref:Uncharacterized protein n=1 Tax=Arundo donax TaxID=35708 RepID=A0A0A9FUV6_ARUDO